MRILGMVGLWMCVVLLAFLTARVIVEKPAAGRDTPSSGEESGPPSGTTEGAACAECLAELESCRAAEWQSFFEKSAAQVPAEAPPPEHEAREAPRQADLPRIAPPQVDVALQQDALCEIASAELRGRWTRSAERISTSLLRSLRDPEWQEREWRGQSREFASALGLDEPDAARLAEAYREIRQKSLDEARVHLESSPPDHAGVYDAAVQLYADEDALVKELHGADALERFRLSQLEKRTGILALLATMAGKPWAEVAW